MLLLVIALMTSSAHAGRMRLVTGEVVSLDQDRIRIRTEQGLECVDLARVSAGARKRLVRSVGRKIRENFALNAFCR